MSSLLDKDGLATMWALIKAKVSSMTSTLSTHTTTLETLAAKNILSYKGAWESGDYSYLDAVTLNGSLYACVNSEGTSETPGDSDDWEETVAAGADGADGKDGTDGADGKDGADGADGADGTSTYIHVAYSTASDGSENFSTTDSTDATYIGILTDSNEEASTNYADYTWTQIRGADGADGASSLTIFFNPTHHVLTVDEDGALNETLGLGGDTDSILYAFVGTEQATVTGIDITSRTNCSVSTTYDSNGATLALSAVATAAKTIAESTTTVPVVSGSFTFTATIVYGSTTYTTEPITVSFIIDYSTWHETLLDTTVGNLSEAVSLMSSLTNALSALTSSVQTIATEVKTIGATAGVDGYDDDTDSITTTVVPLLEDVDEAASAIATSISSLADAVATITEATTATRYTFSSADGLLSASTVTS